MGGRVTAPSFGFFNPQGQWDVENQGVPARLRSKHATEAGQRGSRSQLEKAVSLALDELAKHPVLEPA